MLKWDTLIYVQGKESGWKTDNILDNVAGFFLKNKSKMGSDAFNNHLIHVASTI